jgi:hypothetical protein
MSYKCFSEELDGSAVYRLIFFWLPVALLIRNFACIFFETSVWFEGMFSRVQSWLNYCMLGCSRLLALRYNFCLKDGNLQLYDVFFIDIYRIR